MRMELDHLVVGGPDLAVLKRTFLEQHGLRALPGGRHPGRGTHNALLGLGQGCYLELLAPDPEADGGDWANALAYLGEPALHAWCLRVPDAAEAAARLEAGGLAARRMPGARSLQGGGELRWELVFAEGHGFGGAMPFFVDWLGSQHPSAGLPPEARCSGLALRHPAAPALHSLLAGLGELPQVLSFVQDASPWLQLSLETASGVVEIGGVGGSMTGG